MSGLLMTSACLLFARGAVGGNGQLCSSHRSEDGTKFYDDMTDDTTRLMQRQSIRSHASNQGAGSIDAELNETMQRDCNTRDEDSCLQRAGCAWFEYWGSSQEKLSFNANELAGCRDFDVGAFCPQILGPKLNGADPTNWHIIMGSGQAGNSAKRDYYCREFCSAGSCIFSLRVSMAEEIRGVNYGGIFIPEGPLFSLSNYDTLFSGVDVSEYSKKAPGFEHANLCDLDVPDAADRVKKFLSDMIQAAHFADMASKGFNIVRLPLGYWNLINLPGDLTPSGPGQTDQGLPITSRWRTLQNIMKAEEYMPYIEQVFQYAKNAGLRVLLDFHGAPGQQTGNANTGCDLGGPDGPYFFTARDAWNNKLGIQAIEKLAEICAAQGEACYGIELLNEPYAPFEGAGPERSDLQGWYLQAVEAARAKMDMTKPIVIQDWPRHLHYWRNYPEWFSYEKLGNLYFATHLYSFQDTTTLADAKLSVAEDLGRLYTFARAVPFPVIVTEFGLNSHGGGQSDDHFDYQGLTKWLVSHFNQFPIGSFIWNYQAHDWWGNAWGPVRAAQWLGPSGISWKEIWDLKDVWDVLR